MGYIKIQIVTENGKVGRIIDKKEATPVQCAEIVAELELAKLEILEEIKKMQVRIER